MALQDFWSNLRRGARYFATQPVVDAPRLDTETIERMLREHTNWLAPGTVAGFDEKDFSFLLDGERAKLAKLVADFQIMASNIDPTSPAPNEAVDKAFPLLRDIVQLLEFDRFGDAEAFRLGKLIEREIALRKPPEVAELRFNTGLDHTGDPGLWIWVLLTEDTSSNDDAFLEAARRLRPMLDVIARRVATERWPYLSFRPVSEPAEAMEAP